MLNHEQLAFFEAFGFLHLRALFSSAEMQRLTAAAFRIFDEDAETHPFTGAERQQIQGFVERDPELTDLLADERVLSVARAVLGEEIIWIGSDGNRYVAETGWHPDGSNLAYKRIKIGIYLEALTRETGALRVLPGSHLNPLHSTLRRLLQRSDETITPYGVQASRRADRGSSGFAVSARDVPAYSVETTPGDLVVFDQNIWHSSFGGTAGRAMFTLNFGERPRGEEEWGFIDLMYRGQVEHIRTREWKTRSVLFGNLALDRRDHVRRLVAPLIERGWK